MSQGYRGIINYYRPLCHLPRYAFDMKDIVLNALPLDTPLIRRIMEEYKEIP